MEVVSGLGATRFWLLCTAPSFARCGVCFAAPRAAVGSESLERTDCWAVTAVVKAKLAIAATITQRRSEAIGISCGSCDGAKILPQRRHHQSRMNAGSRPNFEPDLFPSIAAPRESRPR